MPFLDVMNTYFRGEKLEALFFILPIGLALLVFGAVALKAERGGFAWGIAVPAFVFAAVFIATGLGVGLRTTGQVAELTKQVEQAPAAMVEAELPRMQKVKTNFRLTFFAFGILAVIGLGLHYAFSAGWGHGLGAVLILLSALGLLIDGFAERRAEPYTAALEQFAEQQPPGPGEGA